MVVCDGARGLQYEGYENLDDWFAARFQSNFPQTPVDMIYPQTFAIWNSS